MVGSRVAAARQMETVQLLQFAINYSAGRRPPPCLITQCGGIKLFYNKYESIPINTIITLQAERLQY